MDDNKPGTETGETTADTGSRPDEKRKRPGPTIDLEASKVSEVPLAADHPNPEQAADAAVSGPEPVSNSEKKPGRLGILPVAVSALAGALAAALILAVALWAEWPFALNDGGAAEREEASALASHRIARATSSG